MYLLGTLSAVSRERLRGRGEHTFDVFISYRHREHGSVVEVVRSALEAQGLRIWLDKKGGVQPASWGLLLPLLRGLRHSRSVVFLVADDNESMNQRPSIQRDRSII
jgi:hypothetical protein